MPLSRSIAVVDDNEGVRLSLDNLLRSEGHRVRTFASAIDFLADEEARIDALLLDANMPCMTGFELKQELRRRGRDLPTIMITAYPTDAARRQAEEAGIDHFLSKPVDPDVLIGLLSRLIDRGGGTA